MQPRIRLTVYEGSHFVVDPSEIIGIRLIDTHNIGYGKTNNDGSEREYNLMSRLTIRGGEIVNVWESLHDIEKITKWAYGHRIKGNVYQPIAEKKPDGTFGFYLP